MSPWPRPLTALRGGLRESLPPPTPRGPPVPSCRGLWSRYWRGLLWVWRLCCLAAATGRVRPALCPRPECGHAPGGSEAAPPHGRVRTSRGAAAPTRARPPDRASAPPRQVLSLLAGAYGRLTFALTLSFPGGGAVPSAALPAAADPQLPDSAFCTPDSLAAASTAAAALVAAGKRTWGARGSATAAPSCYCRPGTYPLYQGGAMACQPCPDGSYCLGAPLSAVSLSGAPPAGSAAAPAACPPGSSGGPGAQALQDCTCAAGHYMRSEVEGAPGAESIALACEQWPTYEVPGRRRFAVPYGPAFELPTVRLWGV